MFTVVIAEQAYINALRDYEPYIKPYLNNTGVVYCSWFTDGKNLSEAVPELNAAVSRIKEWRVLIICDESGLHQKNPFHTVSLTIPDQESKEDLQTYLERVRKAKCNAYAKAAQQPLTKLATWLCADPLISGEPLAIPSLQEQKDALKQEVDLGVIASWKDELYYNEYLAEAQAKARLREEIRDGCDVRITLPKEVLCIARRTYSEKADDIRTSWSINPGYTYSRFYDWNLYFDKMRYLVFDIMPKTDNGYSLDALRFLNAMAILASNATPSATLQPNTVYRLYCDANEAALQRAVLAYDSKMENTADLLRKKLQEIKTRERPRLTDAEAKRLFCVPTPISVTVPPENSIGDMKVSKSDLGLSTDCPTDEETAWTASVKNSKKAFLHYIKLPRRSIQQSSEDVHGREFAPLKDVHSLNEFQLEDLVIHTQDEEQRMLETRTSDLYDTEAYLARMDKADESVKKEIHSRMKKKHTVIIGAIVLACCLCCFLPMLFTNLNTGKTVMMTLLLAGVFLAVIAITMYLILCYLRWLLRKKYGEYNDTVLDIQGEISSSMQQYAAYLTHACNVLRGNSVINYRTEVGDPDRKQCLILQKHIMDIETGRIALRTLFGAYLNNKKCSEETTDIFEYDFDRPVDYDYLFSFSDTQITRIEYFQPDEQVSIPIDFISRIGARREELYD